MKRILFLLALAGTLSGQTITDVDSLEFDGVFATDPFACRVGTGNYAAVVYEDANEDGWMKTFTVSSTGELGASVADSWEYDKIKGCFNKILTVGSSDTLCAVCFMNRNYEVELFTIGIDAGDINDAGRTDVKICEPGLCSHTSILRLGNSAYYLIGFKQGGPTSSGDYKVETYSISETTGSISAVIDSLEDFSSAAGTDNPLIYPVQGDWYALVCNNQVLAFQAHAADGSLSDTAATYFNYASVADWESGFTMISGFFGITALTNYGRQLFSLNFNSSNGHFSGNDSKNAVPAANTVGRADLVRIRGNFYAYFHTQYLSSPDRYCAYATLQEIEDSGNIKDEAADSIYYSKSDYYGYPHAIAFNDSITLVVRRGDGADGWASTFNTSIPPEPVTIGWPHPVAGAREEDGKIQGVSRKKIYKYMGVE